MVDALAGVIQRAQRNERLALEILGFDEFPIGQAMAGRQHAERFHPAEEFRLHPGMLDGRSGNTEFELAGRDLLVDLDRAARVHRDGDIGPLGLEIGDHFLDESAGQRGNHADDQTTLLEVADTVDGAGDLFDADEGPLDLGVEHASLRRRHQAAAHALEYGEADIVLEGGNELAHRRLRYAQYLRGLTNRAVLDDGLEGLELAQIHGHISRSYRKSSSGSVLPANTISATRSAARLSSCGVTLSTVSPGDRMWRRFDPGSSKPATRRSAGIPAWAKL